MTSSNLVDTSYLCSTRDLVYARDKSWWGKELLVGARRKIRGDGLKPGKGILRKFDANEGNCVDAKPVSLVLLVV